MKKLILIVIMILLIFLFLGADVYVKNMERTAPFKLMGKESPERVEIKEMWLAKNKFAQHGKHFSIIVDYEKEKLYFIVHKAKIYFEIPTDINREKLLELLPPKIAKAVASIKITDVKVNLGGSKKKIANWNCEGTEFEMVFMIPALNLMPKYKIKIWTTKDVAFDHKKYTGGIEEFFAKYLFEILNIDADSKKELEKMDTVDGFQVAAEVTVSIFGSEINVESQCLEVTEKPAPPGAYSVPRGYTKKTISSPQNRTKGQAY